MAKRAKILIVEDEIDLNNAYRIILQSSGYDVAFAFNGEEALEHINKEGDPTIILLDLRMPIMDGINFLKHYDVPSHPDTTVILFSNYDAQKEVDEAYKLGVERYILKARTSPKELIRIIEATLDDKTIK
jgi:two-component system response regulator VicR